MSEHETMTTTRYFEVKVTGCKDCPYADTENRLCLERDFSWNQGRDAFMKNKDQLTDSCPMAAQHKESETK